MLKEKFRSEFHPQLSIAKASILRLALCNIQLDMQIADVLCLVYTWSLNLPIEMESDDGLE